METIENQKSTLQPVKASKNRLLKTRLQALILSKGMSEPEFFHKIGLSRQYWYFISWGIWKTKEHLQIKIAEALDTHPIVIFREQNKLGDIHGKD